MASTADFLGQKMRHFRRKDEQWVISACYTPKQQVGKGAYGMVIAAIDKKTGTEVVIKKIPRIFADKTDATRILREIRMLMHFDNENCCGLYDLIPPRNLDSFEDVYIVLPRMTYDLHQVIYGRRDGLEENHLRSVTTQILRGLKYLHSVGVVHRDLKPPNVLLNAAGEVQICDFGLAKALSMDTPMTEYVVTRWYRAPEILLLNRDYGVEVDVWSVGCILAEMAQQRPLWMGQNSFHQLRVIFGTIGTPSARQFSIIKNPRARSFVERLPIALRQDFLKLFPRDKNLAMLLRHMLEFVPNERASVDECLNHPYLQPVAHFFDKKNTAEPEKFDASFEEERMTVETVKRKIFEAIKEFRNRA